MRKCGDCTLCCKLLPVVELGKKGGQRCRYQRHNKGCSVYRQKAMPLCCELWTCRWLVEDRTGDIRRPDRAHYVIDILPDFVTVVDNISGRETHIPVLQVWCDPSYPDAWRDPQLMAYIERLGAEEGMAAMIRFNEEVATFVAPPSINPKGEWFIQESNVGGPTHRAADFIKAGFGMNVVMEARP